MGIHFPPLPVAYRSWDTVVRKNVRPYRAMNYDESNISFIESTKLNESINTIDQEKIKNECIQ